MGKIVFSLGSQVVVRLVKSLEAQENFRSTCIFIYCMKYIGADRIF